MKDTEQLVMISGIKPYKTPSQKEKELRSFCGKFQRWSDKQWEDITRKYVDGDEIDFYAVARSVSNRKYYRKEVEQ